ncbi:N-acetyltransferase [Microbacterium sorbitolivorans]|uniref:N-acetyltransferase n=1 Tax=Microbacterium sorbitolivorans TaxID=1867410 RepID=A0A367Y6Z6_9MICO|nr:GNAT family N-acetyltransferase [Microbacterium sorbitolivorans]RCK61634.1 N-acetyltransferase [Microbacterium sorbitolivorans]GGF30501.1 N-acetyltransferase [Microbacterium sorbitolivorans]
MQIRQAQASDAAGIAEIYNDAVLNTTAIWNDATVDEADRAAWIAGRQGSGFPVLVAVDGDEVVGYATYGDFRPHDGFRHTVEHSVYVRGDQRGSGIGRQLMMHLVNAARENGVHVMVAAIESGNTGSLRLHEKLGFVETGRMPEVGTKFGRWLDLVLLQLMLDGPR